MNEFTSTTPEQPSDDPLDLYGEEIVESRGESEPTVDEIIDLALRDGFIENEKRDTLGECVEDVLDSLRYIIFKAGYDPDEVFIKWGVVAQEQENQ